MKKELIWVECSLWNCKVNAALTSQWDHTFLIVVRVLITTIHHRSRCFWEERRSNQRKWLHCGLHFPCWKKTKLFNLQGLGCACERAITTRAWSEIWCARMQPNMAVLPPPPPPDACSAIVSSQLSAPSTRKYGDGVAAYEWEESRTPPQPSAGVKRRNRRHSNRECVGTGGRVGVKVWDDFQSHSQSVFPLYAQHPSITPFIGRFSPHCLHPDLVPLYLCTDAIIWWQFL